MLTFDKRSYELIKGYLEMIKKYIAEITDGRLVLKESETGDIACDILTFEDASDRDTKYISTVFTAYSYNTNNGVPIIDRSELIITSDFGEYKVRVRQLVRAKKDIKLSIFEEDGEHLFTVETNGYKEVKVVFSFTDFDTSLNFIREILSLIVDW